jgi:hypothetical protein
MSVQTSTGDPHDLLRQYLAIYDSYHNHKEVMAYTVTAFYLGGAAVLFTSAPFWRRYTVFDFTLFVTFLLVLSGIAFGFVRHQLLLRRSAGDMFKACSRLATTWLSTAPDPGALRPVNADVGAVLFRGFTLPHALLVELQQIEANRTTTWWARDLTYTALLGSGLFVLLRVFGTWNVTNAFARSLIYGE